MQPQLSSQNHTRIEEIQSSNLNLSIVTDGFNGNGRFEQIIWISWLQLNY